MYPILIRILPDFPINPNTHYLVIQTESNPQNTVLYKPVVLIKELQNTNGTCNKQRLKSIMDLHASERIS